MHPSVEDCEISVELKRDGKYPNRTFYVIVYHEKACITGSVEQFDCHKEAKERFMELRKDYPNPPLKVYCYYVWNKYNPDNDRDLYLCERCARQVFPNGPSREESASEMVGLCEQGTECETCYQ